MDSGVSLSHKHNSKTIISSCFFDFKGWQVTVNEDNREKQAYDWCQRLTGDLFLIFILRNKK